MKKKFKEANKVFQKIAKTNKRKVILFPYINLFLKFCDFEFKEENDHLKATLEDQVVKKYGYQHIFKYKSVRSITFIMMTVNYEILDSIYHLSDLLWTFICNE